MPFILILLLLLIVVPVLLYNMLIRRKNEVDNIFGTMDAMLKKRHDLIPNLVETVKEYMDYEKETLTEITRLRAQAVGGDFTDNERVAIESQLGSRMKGLMIAVENYPDLKANDSFNHLQDSWNEVEEQIAASRRAYNGAVTSFNNAIEMFPSNLIANYLDYQPKNVFEIPEEQRENISAKELFDN